MFDDYNPRDAILTFIYYETIAGIIMIIRWILKPEYKSESSPYTIDSCGGCFQSYHNCICHEDDYVDEEIINRYND